MFSEALFYFQYIYLFFLWLYTSKLVVPNVLRPAKSTRFEKFVPKMTTPILTWHTATCTWPATPQHVTLLLWHQRCAASAWWGKTDNLPSHHFTYFSFFSFFSVFFFFFFFFKKHEEAASCKYFPKAKFQGHCKNTPYRRPSRSISKRQTLPNYRTSKQATFRHPF